jgi:hypothetical protein
VLVSCFFSWIFKFFMNAAKISSSFWRDKVLNDATAIEWISMMFSSFANSFLNSSTNSS